MNKPVDIKPNEVVDRELIQSAIKTLNKETRDKIFIKQE